MLYPLLLDQRRVVPFIVDYVAKLADAEPLQSGRTLLQLGDRILELAETGGQATPVTPLLVTMFVDGAMTRARAGGGLEGVAAGRAGDLRGLSETGLCGSFDRGARRCGRRIHSRSESSGGVSLGARLVPSDFSPDEARAALEAAGLSDRATALLEALISGGVIERRTFGGIAVLRFGLDTVAEYLTAIQSVSESLTAARGGGCCASSEWPRGDRRLSDGLRRISEGVRDLLLRVQQSIRIAGYGLPLGGTGGGAATHTDVAKDDFFTAWDHPLDQKICSSKPYYGRALMPGRIKRFLRLAGKKPGCEDDCATD